LKEVYHKLLLILYISILFSLAGFYLAVRYALLANLAAYVRGVDPFWVVLTFKALVLIF
jgi:hypothetical protein